MGNLKYPTNSTISFIYLLHLQKKKKKDIVSVHYL